MALAPFLVEDGTGLAGANSYVSVAEFREYYEIMPENINVIALTDLAIQNLARRATRMIDSILAPPSIPSHEIQGLSFPRSEMTDSCSKEVYPNNIIPPKLKTSTILIMYYFSQNDSAGQSSENSITADNNIKRVKVDVIEVEFDLKKTGSDLADAGLPKTAGRLLQCLGDLGSVSNWALRPRNLIDKERL